MDPTPPYRDLLLADLALVLSIAEARDVAFALQRYWEKRADGASFLDELRRAADLGDEDAQRLEAEAAKLVTEAGGDARLAVGARGGLDRSIHVELSRVAAPLVGELAEAGAGVRSPLPVVPEERYLGFSEIGRGGMGVVYLAVDTDLNRRVAMKVVLPGRTDPDSATGPLSLTPPGPDTPESELYRTLSGTFLQEAWVTGGLEHPGIVPVYELGQTPAGVPYYTMRFVKGERTLERAIEEAETLEDRLGLLEPFLKVCDTLAYAHARGVVHRDLKPANIALGEFGEVVLLDWGLAKLREKPDFSKSRWQDRIEEFREAEDLKTLASGIGTPGYMAPEAVLGKPAEVDEKSDVYSLGAILYRILTGRLPQEFTSFAELLAKLLDEEPVPPHETDAAVPEELSRICHGCLSRSKDERPASVRELARSIRSWQRESAVDREVEGLVREARAAWEDAEGLTGDALLRRIDRVLGKATRALEMRPESAAARSLIDAATAARAGALAERERMARRGLLRRVVVVGTVVIAIVATGMAMVLEERRAETEQALADVLRLSDVKKVRDLIAGADELWPVHPDRAGAMENWIARAQGLVGNRETHETALAALRKRSGTAPEADADAWLHEVLADLVAGIADLADGEGALQRVIKARHALASTSPEQYRTEWGRALAEIADEAACPAYRGLTIEPAFGLVPLGMDPDSGLHEFAHLGSGTVPRRDPETGRLAYEEDSAIVLVLIPGGSFLMGAQNEDRNGPNYDPAANDDESPVREVKLRPHLIAKHECTQAQWATMTGGERPSHRARGGVFWGQKATDRNPVEQVTWEEATHWLPRHRLRLPSEAEWEHACRAGTDTPWFAGRELSVLGEVANISDAYFKAHGGTASAAYTEEVDDGHTGPTAVGSYRANSLGLHDTHGNVWEWCVDWYGGYGEAPSDGSARSHRGESLHRILRGGCYSYLARSSRSANRWASVPEYRNAHLGFRPAASLE